MFQSTRPRGARPDYAQGDWSVEGFNPRAHAGRDETWDAYHAQPFVSIHAPTRGATVQVGAAVQVLSFNPRAHAGRDVFDFS